MSGVGLIHGLDVSHHNGDIDFDRVAKAGAKFAAVKITQGSNFVDPLAKHNIAGFQSAGILVMPYHYFNPADDPSDQLEHFETVCGGFKGMLVPALDVELDSNERTMHAADYTAGIMTWRAKFLKHVGRFPTLYSYRDMWGWMNNPNMSGSSLWLADYHTEPRPLAGWKQWHFWQYTDHGTMDGVPGSGELDLDYFFGGPENLKAWTL